MDLGGPLRAINSLSAEDNCLQLAGSLVRNKPIFLEFSLKYDEGPLKAGAKCPPLPPLLAPLCMCV